MVTKKPVLSPLKWDSRFVLSDGKPSPEFIRLWQQRDTRTGVVPWDAASMSALLDLIGSTAGDVLIRGVKVWGAAVVSGDATLATDGTLRVTGIRGHPVTAVAPLDQQALIYDAGTGNLVWATISGGAYSSFFIDGSGNYYVAVVVSVANPSMVVDGSGVPVYVKNPAFTPNDPTLKRKMLARVFFGF